MMEPLSFQSVRLAFKPLFIDFVAKILLEEAFAV